MMRPVLASTAKAELGALFLNAKHACPLHIALQELGHLQPATPIQTDNTTANGIANDNIKQKQSNPLTYIFIGSTIESSRGSTTYFGTWEYQPH